MKTINSLNLSHFERTMSSLEIAEIIGQHVSNVNRDIKKLIHYYEDEISPIKLSSEIPLIKQTTYKSERGKTYTCYELEPRAVINLISKYSIHLRDLVYTALEEMRERNNKLESAKMESLIEFKPLTQVIKDIYIPAQPSDGSRSHAYSNILDLANKWAVGKIARIYKRDNNLVLASGESVRNHMTQTELELIAKAEKHLYAFIYYMKITTHSGLKEALNKESK